MGFSFIIKDSIFIFFIVFFWLFTISKAAMLTNVTRSQSLKDGDLLTTPTNTFLLGFFSPTNSTARYLGVWYANIPTQTIVWVANRRNPIPENREGVVLSIQTDGNLAVSDQTGVIYWSSNATLASNNTVATLTSAGNLVLSGIDSGKTTRWQSFDNPTDTYLPGMEVLVNRELGENRAFTSWKSVSDPSPGRFTMGVDPRGSPQIVIWDGLDNRKWRSGHWNGLQFVGVPNMTANYLYGFKLSNDEGDGNMFFTYTTSNSSTLFRFLISENGTEELLVWDTGAQKWNIAQSQPLGRCDQYNKCGKFAVCGHSGSSECNCMKGFEPEHEEEWRSGNWSGGCVRSTPLQCEGNSTSVASKDGFLEMKNVKLPDFADLVPGVTQAEVCREECLKNCSCKAYVSTSGLGCFLWTQDLIDIQKFSDYTSGKTLYLRLAGSELDSMNNAKLSKLAIIGIVVAAVVFLAALAYLLFRFRMKLKGSTPKKNNAGLAHNLSKKEHWLSGFPDQESITREGNEGHGTEVPLLPFEAVAVATNNFSIANKLGEGGFGPVYKGILPSGQEVAVKRLSVKSGQGCEEFRNEIILISKLQHRNLVRLLGWSVLGEDKMLIYEYMPNKSLDFFLFDPVKRADLHWNTRFDIIEGIARGLLYLHRDSRLRIIHRDMKAGNILLDEEMNPKISDFGMAKIFGGNQNEGSTVRVVGTYGYMSPEYAMEGLFSVKSDVYSFGVLLLEIVSGRKNTSFHLTENPSLIRYAWSLWTEGKTIELIDPSIKDSCSIEKVLRCIHIGMLCVQDSASYRPNMSTVLIMLESEKTPLPAPKPTSFGSMSSSFAELYVLPTNKGLETISSSNELTIITEVTGR